MNRRELITAMGAAGLLPMVAGCSELLPDPPGTGTTPDTTPTGPTTAGTPILTLNSPTKVSTLGQFSANGQVVVAAVPTNLSLRYPIVLVAVSSTTAVAGALKHPSVANLYLVAYSRVCPHANEIVDTPVNGKMTCVIGHGQEFDGMTGLPVGTKNKTIQALAAFTLEIRNTNEIWVAAVGRDASTGANGGVDSSAPTVTLAASSTSITTAAKVTLTATATEEISASSGLDRVEFYEGATLLGTSTAAPYTLDLNFSSANNGTHNYIANAFDKATNMGSSASVSVVVNIATDGTAPTISLSASSLSVTTAGAVTLTATAADNAGGSGLARVEFYEGATLLGTVAAAPYSFAVNFTNANVGAHNYIAKAFDKAGNTSSSTSVTITNSIGVQAGDTTVPTITLAASSLNFTAAGSLTLTATAADNAGGSGMAKVEFYEGATLLLTKTVAPYTHAINFSAANNGSHVYTAKAYDLANNSASSTPAVAVTVNIAADTTAPTVSLAASSLNITAVGAITLTATAADTGGSGLARVEFYEGTTLLGSKTAAPFTQVINFASANNGSHLYTVKAFDNSNNAASSSVVTVTVNIASVPTGAKIADYAQLASAGSSIEFNHTDTTVGSKSKKGLLYRSLALQTSGIAANGMNLVAYQLDCSHKHCFDTDFVAPTAAHILECSCHNALFNLENNGSFTKPATKALTTIKIEGRADGIYLV
jgi:nitrite reductase/ring-hydroxylating ferredoxin subunit